MNALPNKEQALALLRNLVALAMGYLIAKGTITAEQAATITNDIMIAAPAAIALAGIIWGFFAHTDKAKVESVAHMAAPAVNEALAKVSDAAKIQIAEATPTVATVVVKDTANGKVAALAQSNDHPNVVTETQNEADAKKGTKG